MHVEGYRYCVKLVNVSLVSQKLSRGAEGGPLGKPNTCIGRGFKSKTPDPIENFNKKIMEIGLRLEAGVGFSEEDVSNSYHLNAAHLTCLTDFIKCRTIISKSESM